MLFRSAAYSYGCNVTGVLLSGMLDDGASGLWAIKHLGGHATVQHPEEAEYPSMPLSAVQQVEIDDILPAGKIGPRLVEHLSWSAARATGGYREGEIMDEPERRRLEVEVGVGSEHNAFESGVLNLGLISAFTCPECHGAMVKIQEDGSLRFRCHTGHAYTSAALLSELRESVESTLWSAARVLEENVMLLEHLARHLAQVGELAQGEVVRREAAQVRERSRTVRGVALQSGKFQGTLPEAARDAGEKDAARQQSSSRQ